MALSESGYDAAYTAATCTAFTNPADITLNKNLKDKIRSALHEMRASDKEWRPDRQWVVRLAELGSGSVAADTLRKGFLIAGVSNKMDGSEDDWMFQYGVPIWCCQAEGGGLSMN